MFKVSRDNRDLLYLFGYFVSFSTIIVLLFVWMYANYFKNSIYFSAGEPLNIIKYTEWVSIVIGLFVLLKTLVDLLNKISNKTYNRLKFILVVLFVVMIIGLFNVAKVDANIQLTSYNVTDINTTDNNLNTYGSHSGCISYGTCDSTPINYTSDFNISLSSNFTTSFYYIVSYDVCSIGSRYVEVYNYTNGSFDVINQSSFTTSGWMNNTIINANSSYTLNNITKVRGTSRATGCGDFHSDYYIAEMQLFRESNNAPNNETILTPLNNSRHYNNTINITWNQSDINGDLITSNYQLSNISNFNMILNQGNTTNSYSGNISIVDGVLYYLRVRPNDSYVDGNWSNAIQFTENSKPVISDITLIPNNPNSTNNLTVTMNGTDSENDSLIKHFLWYKNDTLQSSLNDSISMNYSNFSIGSSIYVKGYLNDGYENSSQQSSITVVVGSINTAPVLSGISLSSSTRKYNKQIYVNTTNIITDTDSDSVRLLVYYYSSGNKLYLNNGSWIVPSNNSSVLVTIPWNDGLEHTIYGIAYDSGNPEGVDNLTSTERYATFMSDINPPNFINYTLSSGNIGYGASNVIYLNVECTQTTGFNDCSIQTDSVKVKVQKSDGSYGSGDDGNGNWTMIHDSGTLYYMTYTTTIPAGTYSVRNFYAIDDSGVNGSKSLSSLTFYVNPQITSTGGGGGGAQPIDVVNVNVTWKLSTDRIDIPLFIIGDSKTWNYEITSNVKLSEIKSSKIQSKIFSDSKIQLSYVFSFNDDSFVSDEIIVKNEYGEYKTIYVKLNIYDLSSSFMIYPIYIDGISDFDIVKGLFVVKDDKLIAIRSLTLYSLIIGLGLLVGFVYLGKR